MQITTTAILPGDIAQSINKSCCETCTILASLSPCSTSSFHFFCFISFSSSLSVYHDLFPFLLFFISLCFFCNNESLSSSFHTVLIYIRNRQFLFRPFRASSKRLVWIEDLINIRALSWGLKFAVWSVTVFSSLCIHFLSLWTVLFMFSFSLARTRSLSFV